MSVIDKLATAQAVIWLDEVQYTKGGWTNRNRLPGGEWLTVPVERSTDGESINRVRIAQHPPWRRKMTEAVRQAYGDTAVTRAAIRQINLPYRLLVGLNVSMLRALWPFVFGEHGPQWHFQSHLDGGHAVEAVSDDAARLAPISERLAMMVVEVGGTTYLSGPSGRNYLDEGPFHRLGVSVEYYAPTGDNDSMLTHCAKVYA